MADKWPLANGNWSDAANWNSGTKPVTGDNVYADGKIVAIDETPASGITLRNDLRSGGTTGGGFTLSTNMTLNAGIYSVTQAAAVPALAISGSASVDIIGSITHVNSSPSDNRYAVTMSSSGALSITGDLINNSNRSNGGPLLMASGSALTIVGNLQQNSTSPVVTFTAAPATTITGNVTAGSNGAVLLASSSPVTLTITGNMTCTSGAACFNSASYNSIITVIGNVVAIGGTVIYNIQSGAMTTVIGNVTNTNSIMAICAQRLRIASSGSVTWQFQGEAGGNRLLYSADVLPGVPAATDVRSGTTYGPSSELTGTLVVPPAGSVALGVPVDNTTGTAAITQQAIADAVGPLIAAYGS